MLVVTIPKTAVKMNETRKRRAMNRVRKTVKRERRTKSEGSRMNQHKRKAMLLGPSKISFNHTPTKFPTAELSRERSLCRDATIRAARRPRLCDDS